MSKSDINALILFAIFLLFAGGLYYYYGTYLPAHADVAENQNTITSPQPALLGGHPEEERSAGKYYSEESEDEIDAFERMRLEAEYSSKPYYESLPPPPEARK
jgi:hypothetical protein